MVLRKAFQKILSPAVSCADLLSSPLTTAWRRICPSFGQSWAARATARSLCPPRPPPHHLPPRACVCWVLACGKLRFALSHWGMPQHLARPAHHHCMAPCLAGRHEVCCAPLPSEMRPLLSVWVSSCSLKLWWVAACLLRSAQFSWWWLGVHSLLPPLLGTAAALLVSAQLTRHRLQGACWQTMVAGLPALLAQHARRCCGGRTEPLPRRCPGCLIAARCP